MPYQARHEDWMNRKWRPAIGWTYMAICIFDFIAAPILWSLAQAFYYGVVNQQWEPITMVSGGLFHIAMGAILGITAWSRGKEKLGQMHQDYDSGNVGDKGRGGGFRGDHQHSPHNQYDTSDRDGRYGR